MFLMKPYGKEQRKMKRILVLVSTVLAIALLGSLLLIQGCVTKEKANQAILSSNKQRSLRVFSFGQFRANAFLLKPGLALTNKHVCDTPDFLLVNNDGVAQAAIEMTSSKDYDLCVIKTEVNAKFDYGVSSLKVYSGEIALNTEVQILGYSLRRTGGEPPPVLTRSSGITIEVVDLRTGQDPADETTTMYAEYFDDNVASTLPIIPGCSGSPVYAPSGSLVGVANAVTRDGLGVFVKSSNLIKFLNESGVMHVTTDSIN